MTHVYVIRRALEAPVVRAGSVNKLAHSALLLKTEAGQFFTLEYMNDATAHLTRGESRDVKAHKNYVDIRMMGWSDGRTMEFDWERQLRGRALEPKQTPEELRELMQSLMKGYDKWGEEQCHTAQERVRKRLGIFE